MSKRVVIVGSGFAGFQAARKLAPMAKDGLEVVVVNPTDYFLYLPLLPEVASGVLEPRRISVALDGTMPGVRLVLGEVDGVDLSQQRVSYLDPEGNRGELDYDRLVLAVGSVHKLLPIPGVADHALGFRGVPEALYLRDHITRQIELADATDDADERAARMTFVVVGAGYTGTEVAAHGQLFTDALVRHHPRLRGQRPGWKLLDVATRPLPGMDTRLSATADRVMRRRGVDIRMETSVKQASSEGVVLSDDEFVPTRSLIWCVGVRPDPLVEGLGLRTNQGRLAVDKYLTVPNHPEVYACGDAAAVPDLTNPGELTPMTAQHATRQGKLVAQNILASYGHGSRRPYRHHPLGFLVDLGGAQAAANPAHVTLPGPIAKVVTRGFHFLAMPGNRVRVAVDWFVNAVQRRQPVQLGLVRGEEVPLESASPETPEEPTHR